MIYHVYENDQEIASGGAQQIGKFLGVSDMRVYQASSKKELVKGKYKILRSGEYDRGKGKRIIDTFDEEGKKIFTGTMTQTQYRFGICFRTMSRLVKTGSLYKGKRFVPAELPEEKEDETPVVIPKKEKEDKSSKILDYVLRHVEDPPHKTVIGNTRNLKLVLPRLRDLGYKVEIDEKIDVYVEKKPKYYIITVTKE